MKFHIREVNERPWADFVDVEGAQGWLLSAFLEDVRTTPELFLEELEKAELGEDVPTGYTCNHVDISFYPDRAVIEDLFPENPDNEPSRVELPLAEAKRLMLDWRKSVEEWEKQHS